MTMTTPWDLHVTSDGVEILRYDGSIESFYSVPTEGAADAQLEAAVGHIVDLLVSWADAAASDQETAAAPAGANAPYKIKKVDGEWAVVNNTGAVKAKFGNNRQKALDYLRALYANVKGASARANKTKFTGKAKDRVAAKSGKSGAKSEKSAAENTPLRQHPFTVNSGGWLGGYMQDFSLAADAKCSECGGPQSEHMVAEPQDQEYAGPYAYPLEAAAKGATPKAPYGNVSYADPGYQKDGKRRYPLDTEEHVRAAWSYINQGENANRYTTDQLARIKSAIRSAAKRLGIKIDG